MRGGTVAVVLGTARDVGDDMPGYPCPACRRNIGGVGGLTRAIFRPHSDKAGHVCPGSGEPIAASDAL